MIPLIPAPYQFLAKALIIAVVMGALAYGLHRYNDHLREQGRAEIRPQLKQVQDAFTAYRATINAEAAERERQNKLKDAKVTQTNEAAIHVYETKLASIAADRNSLSRMLNKARVSICSNAVPAAENLPTAPDATPKSWSQAKADELLELYDRRCQEDSAQLEALIAELKPQLTF